MQQTKFPIVLTTATSDLT